MRSSLDVGPEKKRPSSSSLLEISKMGKVRNLMNISAPLVKVNTPALDSEAHELIMRLTTTDEQDAKVLLGQNVTRVFGSDKRTLLHEAVLASNVRAVRLILEDNSTDVNLKDASGLAALHWACSSPHRSPESFEVLSALLAHSSCQVDVCDAQGCTPLMMAADQSNDPYVVSLLNAGADPNKAVSTVSSSTSSSSSLAGIVPICIAAWHGSFAVCEALISSGAVIDVHGEDGMTPLMIAARNDNMDLVVFLVKSGATVDMATKASTAKELATSPVLIQFLEDSAFYQTHHKRKKQQAYQKMVGSNRMRQSSNAGMTVGDSSPSGKPVYTSENYPLDLDYFEHPILGEAKIGMCMCPGRNKSKKVHSWKRDLQTDLQVIQTSKADIVLTLVKSKELLSMGIMEIFVRIKQLGMESVHFPVPDKWIPESMTEVVQLIEKMLEFVKAGKRIVVHCNGGKGRTGMVAVATLAALGMPVDEGIRVIRSRRSGMIRNPAQIVYLRLFETRWKNEHTATYAPWSASSASADAEKALTYELKKEKKYGTGNSAVITLRLMRFRDFEAETASLVVLGVSGPLPRNRTPLTVTQNMCESPWENAVRFVVAEMNSWYCLLGLTNGTDVLATCLLAGGNESSRGSQWGEIRKKSDQSVCGMLNYSYMVEKR